MRASSILAAALLAPAALGAGSAGTSAEAFLQIPILARPAAMAGADTALATGIEGLDYNPAGLADLANWDLSADHLAYAQGISLDEVAAGWGRGGYGGALSVISLGTPSVVATDSSGNPVGTFREQDLAFTGGAAGAWGPWSLGLAARGVTMSLAGFDESGAEADLGAAYQPWDGLRLGLAVQHLGFLNAGSNVADPTALTVRGGLGWSGKVGADVGLAVDLDVVDPNDSSPQYLLGAEASYSLVYLRAGGEWNQDWDMRQTATFGGGFRLGDVQLDYAFADLSGLGVAQRFGLRWRPGAAAAPSLTAPSGLSVKQFGLDLVLSWRPVPGAKAYWVYLRRDGVLQRLGTHALAVAHARLKKAATVDLDVAVSAVGADGEEGPKSEEFKHPAHLPGTPETPLHVRVSAVQGRRKLQWDPGDALTDVKFQVMVGEDPAGEFQPVGKPMTGREIFLNEASVRRTVYIEVVAQRAAGGGILRSLPSDPLAVAPK
jgi:hypothetical protein